MSTGYLNGRYLPTEEATIPVDDRGFLLADGVYEVTPAYRGRFFRLDEHLERLRFGLRELRIDFDVELLPGIHRRLLEENDLQGEEVSFVYVQVTRGVAPRTHAFPEGDVRPTVYAFGKAFRRPPRERWERGFTCVTVPDRRWSRVDIKSIALLPNVLAQQAAVERGADEALLVRDGVALEGAHNNVFAVLDGVVVTHPATNLILHGITRRFVLELARELDRPVAERPIQVEELRDAEEVFFTGTTTEVKPMVEVDGRPVGSGKVGPVARELYDAFLGRTLEEVEAAAREAEKG